jgi:alpha-ribazole phosphatase
MLKLYLVRHGESAWNVKHFYTGQTDVPLSVIGEAQAERLAERLGQVAFEACYASPLKRARETASPLLLLQNAPLRPDERLAEIHHGAWEGHPSATVQEQYAEAYLAWRTQPQRAQMPQGESLGDVAERVTAFLDDLFAQHRDGDVLVVSHDAVLRVFLVQVLGMGLEFFWRWRFDNASVSIVEHVPDGHFRLALLNDTHHLAGVQTHCDAQAL